MPKIKTIALDFQRWQNESVNGIVTFKRVADYQLRGALLRDFRQTRIKTTNEQWNERKKLREERTR